MYGFIKGHDSLPIEAKGKAHFFFCSLSLALLSSNYYVIVFLTKLIMRVQRGLEASISKKISTMKNEK